MWRCREKSRRQRGHGLSPHHRRMERGAHPDRVRSHWRRRWFVDTAANMQASASSSQTHRRQPGRAVPHRARLRPCGSGRPHAQRCGGEIRPRRECGPEANMAKLLASEAAWEAANACLDAHAAMVSRANSTSSASSARPGLYDGADQQQSGAGVPRPNVLGMRNPIELLTPSFSRCASVAAGWKQTRRPAMRMSTYAKLGTAGDRRLDGGAGDCGRTPGTAQTAAPRGERRRRSLSRHPRLGADHVEKRPWGGSNGVAVDKDGKTIWATDRCSPGTLRAASIRTSTRSIISTRTARRSKVSRRHVRLAARHPCG